MEDAFRITRKAFIIIIFSVLACALFLRFKIPDVSILTSLVYQTVLNPLIMRFMLIGYMAVIALGILFMPFSAFLVYWASVVFAVYYLFSRPVEAAIFLSLLSIPALMNRLGAIQYPEVKITLPVVFVASIAFSIFSLVALATSSMNLGTSLFLLLPALHILSMRPGEDAGSRFHGEESQVNTGLSSIQSARKSLSADWWEYVRPHVESIALNIYRFFDNFSDIKSTTGQRNAPHVHTRAQDNARNINLANLKKRDRNFNDTQFLQRVKGAFFTVMEAFYNHKVEEIHAFVSDSLFEQFQSHIAEQKAAGIKYRYELQNQEGKSARFSIDHVYSDHSFDEIQVLVQLQIVETPTDINTGRPIGGSQVRNYHEYWSFIRRPSAKTLQKPGLIEKSCPNCGAPLVIGQATVCKSCNSYIRSGFYDWVLAKITQGCEWSYSDPTLVPAWKNLKAADPDFSIHQIEDLAGVIFWNLRLSDRIKSSEPIFRFAAGDFAESMAKKFKEIQNQKFSYFENIGLASVSLKGIEIASETIIIYVLVVWSGIPVNIEADGRVAERIRYNKPVRDVLVFSRDSGQKTNMNNTLSSAHCQNCGGPLKSSYATHCGYCGSQLNDGREWQLQKIIKEESKEYQEILSQKAKIVSERFAQNMAVEAAKTAEKVVVEETRSGRDIISVMVQILLADNVVDDAEMRFIREMAAKYHMPDDTLNGIIESIKENSVFVPRPQNGVEAMEILKGAVEMAYADGVLAPEEEKSLEFYAQQFGYSKFDLKRLLKSKEKDIYKAQIRAKAQKLKSQDPDQSAN